MRIKPTGFDPFGLPESNTTSYPEPYRAENQRRWNRRFGEHAGLTNFGADITRIVPGGQSSSRWHSRQDEFIYVLSGEVILETDSGEEIPHVGMCAGFPPGRATGIGS
jgi:uncharacterized cupin superfamily protein